MDEINVSFQFWGQEIAGAILPHERFRTNLTRMCCELQSKPEHSFSAACGPAVRKAAHRLFSRESSLDIQLGHREMTLRRAEGHEMVLIVEDTTDLNYAGHLETDGLGNLGGKGDVKGLCMHSALAIGADGNPFGLVGQHIWAPTSGGRPGYEYEYAIEEKESYKWIRTKQWVNEWFKHHKGWAVVVGDREADFYEHFAWPREEPVEILVRARYTNRNIFHDGQPKKLWEVAAGLQPIGEMEVEVKRQQGRKARTARLEVRVAEIECPAATAKKGPTVGMTLVHAKEKGTSGEAAPIEWWLLTTLKVGSLEEACEVVGFYVLRWVIERFHYVLKQGMNVERLQFDNFTRLSHALEVCSMVAWHLLWMSRLAKAEPMAEAIEYFDKTEITILEKCTGKKIRTTTDYVLALGKLSGFVKSKAQPLPGEKLLWQSIKLLNAMKTGFQLNQQSYGTG
jgi:hypothetical protein